MRKLDKQFSRSKLKRIREIERRLQSLKSPVEQFDVRYLSLEAVGSLEAGLLFASLQVMTSLLEFIARHLFIYHRSLDATSRSRATRDDLIYDISKAIEEDRSFGFPKLLEELKAIKIFTTREVRKMLELYKRIRNPIHHAITGRYARSRDKYGFHEVFKLRGGREFEEAIERHAIPELELVCSAIESILAKFAAA